MTLSVSLYDGHIRACSCQQIRQGGSWIKKIDVAPEMLGTATARWASRETPSALVDVDYRACTSLTYRARTPLPLS